MSRPGRPASDAELAGLVAGGDGEAFAALYDRYARTVYTLAVHALGRADAEEVVQDVFVRLWRRAAQFDRERGSFAAWFMAIAHHRLLDELRRRGSGRVAAEAIEQLLVEADDPAADPALEASTRARNAALLVALRRLPAEQRRVLVLAYFGGLSQSAIAEALGWPLGTVKKRTRLALQKLRGALAAEDDAATSEVVR